MYATKHLEADALQPSPGFRRLVWQTTPPQPSKGGGEQAGNDCAFCLVHVTFLQGCRVTLFLLSLQSGNVRAHSVLSLEEQVLKYVSVTFKTSRAHRFGMKQVDNDDIFIVKMRRRGRLRR